MLSSMMPSELQKIFIRACLLDVPLKKSTEKPSKYSHCQPFLQDSPYNWSNGLIYFLVATYLTQKEYRKFATLIWYLIIQAKKSLEISGDVDLDIHFFAQLFPHDYPDSDFFANYTPLNVLDEKFWQEQGIAINRDLLARWRILEENYKIFQKEIIHTTSNGVDKNESRKIL